MTRPANPARILFAFWGSVLLVLLLAFALRVWQLNAESVWHDEGWSIRAMRGPFTTPDDNTPFLYYLTGHLLWRAGAGETPFAFRYTSVLIGLLTVAAAIALGRRWFGRVSGVTIGTLVAVSPLLWEYSQEVRAYVAVPLIAVVILGGAETLLRYRPGERIPRRVWGFLLLVELAGLYTHNLAVPLVVWLNVVLGVGWLFRRDWLRMAAWAGLQLLLIAAYVPWLLTQSPSGTPLNTPPEPGLRLSRDIWYAYFLPVLKQHQDTGSVALLTLAGTLAAVLVTFTMTRRGRSSHALPLLVSHAAFVPIFSTLLMLVAHIDFHPRYFIAAVPGTLLLLVGAVTYITSKPRLRAAGYALIALPVILISAASIRQIHTTRGYQHDDFAGLAAYYATLPEDAVILVPFDVERALQDYYADALGIRARVVNIPLYSDENAVIQALNALLGESIHHVELLTWFQLPADVRGMYPCLLTAYSEAVDDPQTYYGLMTQAYTLHAQAAPRTIPTEAHYREVTLHDLTYWGGENGVCLRGNWSLNTLTGETVAVAAALLDPLGHEIARSDSEITRPDNAGTRHWTPGDTGQTYHLLRLPDGAPPLHYTLTLNVYTLSQPSGFDLLDALGNPTGKTHVLPQAIAAHGLPLAFAETVLLEDNAGADGTIETGRPLDVTVGVAPQRHPVSIVVSLAGDSWQIDQTAQAGALAWHRFIVPPGNSGQAALLVNGVTLAHYTIVDAPRLFESPAFDIPVEVRFPGIGTLVGVTLNETLLSPQNPFEVTLVWRAEAQTTSIDYTVFVQLITEDGRVVAQSDSHPAEGTRPTAGWVAREYIIDTHTLRFNLTDYTGAASLIAGFYDANVGFRRAQTATHTDHARVPVDIRITQ